MRSFVSAASGLTSLSQSARGRTVCRQGSGVTWFGCVVRTSAVVGLARGARVVAAALDAVERHPRIRARWGGGVWRWWASGRRSDGALGAVPDEAVVQLDYELGLARLKVQHKPLVPSNQHLPRHGRGRCRGVHGRVGRHVRQGRRWRWRRWFGGEQRCKSVFVGGHERLRVEKRLGEGGEGDVHVNVGAHLLQLVALDLPRLVELVVAQEHLAVVAVGACDLDVGLGARGDCEVDLYFLHAKEVLVSLIWSLVVCGQV